MTKFQKGQSGNPKGRPRGSQNEKTRYIKEWLVSLIGSNAKDITQRFKSLPMKERCKFITSVLPYVLPKQTESRIKANVDLNHLSDEQIDSIISEITVNVDTEEDDGEQ